MQSQYHKDYGPKSLIVQPTSKIYIPIDMSRKAQIPSEKRKAHDPQSTECIFVGYPIGVKGYRSIDLSSD
jgi:hypothetical protein